MGKGHFTARILSHGPDWRQVKKWQMIWIPWLSTSTSIATSTSPSSASSSGMVNDGFASALIAAEVRMAKRARRHIEWPRIVAIFVRLGPWDDVVVVLRLRPGRQTQSTLRWQIPDYFVRSLVHVLKIWMVLNSVWSNESNKILGSKSFHQSRNLHKGMQLNFLIS